MNRIIVLSLAAFVGSAPLVAQSRPSTADSAQTPFDLASFTSRPEVQRYLDYFTGRGRPRVARSLERAQPFQSQIGERLAAAGLPAAFRFLPMIESGFSSNAVSKKGAVGMWQFMPETARAYGLRVDRLVDERRDPWRATDAAVRHLSDLNGKFSSNFLAAAAYNAGAGRVERGLDRLGNDDSASSGQEGQFFRLAQQSLLAKETRNYVPQLIAAAMIGQNPGQYGFAAESTAGTPAVAFDSITVERPTRLDRLARMIGVAPEVLRRLNPQFVVGLTPPNAASLVRIPAGLGALAAAKLVDLPTAIVPAPIEEDPSEAGDASLPAPADAHVLVRRGESLDEVALRSGISVQRLRRANALPKRYRLRPGQILRVPR